MQARGHRFESVILHATSSEEVKEIIDIIGKKEDTREEKEHEKVKKSARGMPVAPRGEEGRDKLRKAAGRRK